MAKELQAQTFQTTGTVYARVRNAASQIWYTVTPVLEAFNAAHIASYAVGSVATPGVATQDGTTGFWTADMPATMPGTAAVPITYYFAFYLQAGGSPAQSDQCISTVESVDWNGTVVQQPASVTSGKITGVVLADTLTTYTGNTPQTGDSFARIGATGSGLTSLAPSLTALSTAQWTNTLATNLGTLAGHDPGATLASQTNITGGTITTVTNLTNLPAITANWLTAAGIAAGALNGKGDWLLASSYTAPPSAAAISAVVWAEVSHTLTAFTIPVQVSDMTAAALAKFFTVDTGQTAGDSVAGSVVFELLDGNDIWAIPLPGAYPAGTAGYIVGNNLNAPVGSVPAGVFAAAMTDGGYNFLQWLAIVGAVVAGKSSGGPSSPVYNGMGTNTTRMSAVCDDDGNRTSITISA